MAAVEAATGIAGPRVSSPLSIVIPVGPGDTAWRGLLADLAALPQDCEIILAATDADPAPDDLPPLAASLRWLTAPRGRPQQLNAGAAVARHPRLCFLHADSRLPAASLQRLLATEPAASLHYFDLRFAADGPTLMGLNTLGTWIRSRWLGLPFGDQGLLLARADFERLGGFDTAITRGEDHAFVWSARRAGLGLRPLRAPIVTSARRYAACGWWRTTCHHLGLTWQQARHFARQGGRK